MKLVVLVLVIVFCSFTYAQQNLVPNYSFEDTTECPYSSGKINFALPWGNANELGTCDLFHECSFVHGIPNNFFGNQFARTGKAYAGFAFFLEDSVEAREYLTVKLTKKLIKGNKYCVRFYVSLAETSKYGIDKLGLYFSDTLILISGFNLILYTPQIEYLGGIISVMDDWVLISGEFLANGGEEYIVIGNFYRNDSTNKIPVSSTNEKYSYFYIDDVSVYLCEDTLPVPSDTFYLHIPNVFTPNADGKNDTWQVNAKGVQQLHAAVYNRWGSLLWQQEVQATDTTNQTLTISWDGRSNTGMPASAGTYYYLVTCTTKEGEIKKEKGFLTLTR